MTSSSPKPPDSPADSYYAMTDDEDDLQSITHSQSGRGVKLLYSKSKVYIHPTPSSKDNIPGFIALLQQKSARLAAADSSKPPQPTSCDGADTPSDRVAKLPSESPSSSTTKKRSSSDLLLAWVPESTLGDAASIYIKVDLTEGDSPPKQSYLVPPLPTVTQHRGSIGHYAFAIPVSDIYSLLVRPPSLGWWFGSVIINTRAGDSFPALFFHDSECQSTMLQRKRRARDTFDPFGEGGEMFWGGDEVLRWLRRYVTIERSAAEPSIYLIEPSRQDSEAFSAKPTSSDSPRAKKEAKSRNNGKASASRDAAMDPVMKFVKETGWNIMERFSKVTSFTRQAANDVLENPRMPPQVRRLLKNREVQTLQQEFDSARLYLARWAMGMAEQGERDRVQRQRMWTVKDVMALEDTDVGQFELLDSASPMTLEDNRRPVTRKEWASFFDPRTARLAVSPDEVKERVFHGGLDPDNGVRKEAWLFLLGVFDWNSTADGRKALESSLRNDYIRLKAAWWERLAITVDGGEAGEEQEQWREQRNRIEKDVHRTDRNVDTFAGEDIPHPDPASAFADVGTNVHLEQMKDMLLTYNEYNKGLGYVQGMSDLLAPLYAVLQDDALAFWAFQRLMGRMEQNFLRDQSGMRSQLLALDHLVQFMDPKLYSHLQSADSTNFFFFYRMLLVWFKREFSWDDVLRLWEALWTDFLTSNFHLFIAMAILDKHREVMMLHLKHFDEVLKYVNELSGTMDLESTLVRAEQLFRRFQRLVETIDKKGNFPAPRVRAISDAACPSSSSPMSSPSRPLASGRTTEQQTPIRTQKDKGKEPESPQQQMIITPELRRLLHRDALNLSQSPD